MHGDHVGNAHRKAPNSGTCDKTDISVSALPNSSAVNIALGRTLLRFSDLKPNVPIPADTFKFNPPKGADVIEDAPAKR